MLEDYATLCTIGNAQLYYHTLSDQELLLVDGSGIDQTGSAWHVWQQDVQDSFSTTSHFQITPVSNPPADGFAFVIQNTSFSALGRTASGLGFDGMPNSLAIMFDTYQNVEESDPSSNYIAVQSLSVYPKQR
ncbi:MAG: L-type lectin-domain containing protein [Aggregatilineales bacterium]